MMFFFGRGQWSPLSAMFPNTVLVLMGVLSVAVLVKAFVRPERRLLFAEGSRARTVVTAVALLVWVWAISILGFYLASLLVFTALTLYIAQASRKIRPLNVAFWLVIIAVELAVLNFIFSRLLFVRLPAGPFSF
jgi:hypothetical protein